MYIHTIKKIENYRNLCGKAINFNKSINYIIGENNIGKTNILELINTIINTNKFSEDDFTDISNGIKIEFVIFYDDFEIGFFDGYFDPSQLNSITIFAFQKDIDSRIEYFIDEELTKKISTSLIKKINVLYYFSQRLPSKEVDFKKTTNSGKILNFLVKHNMEKLSLSNEEMIKKKSVSKIMKELNMQICDISSISGDDIRAGVSVDSDKILSRILTVESSDGSLINMLGDGAQYAFNILLNIFELIHRNKYVKYVDVFEERLIEDNGKKLFPLFLIIDEPEIHQHPYRQRMIMKNLIEIIENRNTTFLKLIKELFDIDGVTGQIIVATHSCNILLNDYKQFIRLDRNDNVLNITCGVDIRLGDKLYKHLLRDFTFLKEALFSKGVLFVEGDTEFSAINAFLSREGIDLDCYSLSVVKLNGADSIVSMMEVYAKFNIKCLAILDKDKKSKYSHLDNVFFTSKKDFEYEIYSYFRFDEFIKYKREECIDSLIGHILSAVPTITVDEIKNSNSIFSINENVKKNLMKTWKKKEIEKMKSSKNADQGYRLAMHVTKIPVIYKKTINLLIKDSK